ncbi:MAG: UrcA family protein [Thermaurantiacus sp.]
MNGILAACAAGAALLIGSAAIAKPGLTGFHPPRGDIILQTADLDLATDRDARILHVRAARAARDLCLGDHPLPHRMITLEYFDCVDQVQSTVRDEVNRIIREHRGARVASR